MSSNEQSNERRLTVLFSSKVSLICQNCRNHLTERWRSISSSRKAASVMRCAALNVIHSRIVIKIFPLTRNFCRTPLLAIREQQTANRTDITRSHGSANESHINRLHHQRSALSHQQRALNVLSCEVCHTLTRCERFANSLKTPSARHN
jgi:hypothetical protein